MENYSELNASLLGNRPKLSSASNSFNLKKAMLSVCAVALVFMVVAVS